MVVGRCLIVRALLLDSRFLPTTLPMMQMVISVMSAVGGHVVTTALKVNVNRTKVGKDGFYKKLWACVLNVDVCTACMCVF